MNAKELYDVVKDVPEGAWPHHCEYFTNEFGSASFHYGPCMYTDEAAELLFIGSMVKWLQSLAFIVEMYYEHQDGRTRVALSGSGAISRKMAMETICRGSSTVAALSAACKAVGGGE